MATKTKILIVDDDNNIAELISLYLTKECYDTKIVNDGEEALAAFDSYNPNMILLHLVYNIYQRMGQKKDNVTLPLLVLLDSVKTLESLLMKQQILYQSGTVKTLNLQVTKK